ncbi:MAG: RAP domain-containing protein [Aquiluna sp.]
MAEPNLKIAVEFDGPSHFLMDVDGRTSVPNGPSIFKGRMLSRLGWRVWHVSYLEWDSLKSNRDREEYLSRGLAELRNAEAGFSMGQPITVLDHCQGPPSSPLQVRPQEEEVAVEAPVSHGFSPGDEGCGNRRLPASLSPSRLVESSQEDPGFDGRAHDGSLMSTGARSRPHQGRHSDGRRPPGSPIDPRFQLRAGGDPPADARSGARRRSRPRSRSHSRERGRARSSKRSRHHHRDHVGRKRD